MSRGPSTFKQRDLKAAIKAAAASGAEIARVEIDKITGNIAVVLGKPAATLADELDQELAEFTARHGDG